MTHFIAFRFVFFFFFICINVTVLIKQAFIEPLALPKNLEVHDIVLRALGCVLGLCLFICVKRRGEMKIGECAVLGLGT